MILRLDWHDHGWAGAGDGVLAEDLDVVCCEVLLDSIVPQEDSASNAAGVQRLDDHSTELD